MIQLELFDNRPKSDSSDVSTFASVFLKLFTASYADPELEGAYRADLVFFVNNCSNYDRGLYCEWIIYYASEWEVDLGEFNRHMLDQCIFSGGERETLGPTTF